MASKDKESLTQSKIIKAIEAEGGIVVNGTFTKVGISDLICGVKRYNSTGLEFVTIEVKTGEKLTRILNQAQADITSQMDSSFRWDVSKVTEPRAAFQLLYLNKVRDRGGRAYIVSSVKHLHELGIFRPYSPKDKFNLLKDL